MSDPTPSDDELISSYIDGEATLDEVARIQADPELRARIQEFEAAKDLLSSPVPPLPESDVDRLVDNALWQSTTSDRITDLLAVRAMRRFSPQRLATIAATLVLLAGVVGALIALNNSGAGDEIASTSGDSSEMADESFGDDGDDMAASEDDMADDSDMADSVDDMADSVDDMADDSDMADSVDDMADDSDLAESAEEMADAMPESDMAEDDSDLAEPYDSEQSVTDDPTAATTTVAAADPPRIHRLLNIEIAESYQTLDELIDHTADQWRELVATDFAGFIVPYDEEGNEQTEQALAAIPCGQSLLTHMYAMPDIDGVDTLRISETTINGIPISIAVLVLTGDHSPDTAALLTASEPNCTVSQIATLSP